jgi:hypothetical protein
VPQAQETAHTKRWSVDAYLYQEQDATSANVMLHSEVLLR